MLAVLQALHIDVLGAGVSFESEQGFTIDMNDTVERLRPGAAHL
jgi:hypothetical protein